MLKVYGRRSSGNVQKVLWCLAELGLDHEVEEVGGTFGRNKEPAYLAMNPNGLVPTLVDGDFVLWESNTIVRYLDRAYGMGKLSGGTAKSAALAERWMDWQLTIMAPAQTPMFIQLYRTAPENRDPGVIERSRQANAAAFQLIEDHLGQQKFIAGDSLTVGDIPVGIHLHRWMQMPIERPKMPKVEAWYQRLVERPGYRTHIMIPIT